MNKENQQQSFGTRLKLAREATGLEFKEIAAQLHLNEKFIHMMEKETYPADLPPTFIRGYLRSYAKLLEIPENEVKEAIEAMNHHSYHPSLLLKPFAPITSDNYFIKFFTYFIILTIIGLAGAGWYTRNTQIPTTIKQTIVEAQPTVIPIQMKPVLAQAPTEKNIEVKTKKIVADDHEETADGDEEEE